MTFEEMQKRIVLIRRTDAERKAYMEGFVNGFKAFKTKLKYEKTEEAAIKSMETLIKALQEHNEKWESDEK